MKLDARLVEKGAQAAAGKKFEPIVGKFAVRVDSVESAVAKNGNDFLKMGLSLADGRTTRLNIFPVSSFRGKTYMSRQFKTLLAAAGVRISGADFDEQMLLGKTVIAYLSERERDGTMWQDVQKFAEISVIGEEKTGE